MLVSPDKQKNDPITQLHRRIHYVVYHVKINDIEYKEITFTMEQFLNLVEQKQCIGDFAQKLINKGINIVTDDVLSEIKKEIADSSSDQTKKNSDN